MPEVTIRSADPVQMYWRMVFYRAAEPDSELIITSKDEETGIFTVSLNGLIETKSFIHDIPDK